MSARLPVAPSPGAPAVTPPDPSSFEALEKRIGKEMADLNGRLQLYGEGDRILVGMSGGKDSYTLLHMLRRAQRLAPFHFEVLPFHLEQGHPGFPVHILRNYLQSLDIPFVIEHQDTYSIVTEKVPVGHTPCSLCSRLRRGILYDAARRHGCTKVALGHHRDDLIETLLLNLFYSGMLATMPPKLVSDEGDNMVIRPLAQVPEATIREFAALAQFPVIPCSLCGRGRDLKRDRIGRLVSELEAEIPDLSRSILAAMKNVRPSHLLDEKLFDHANLATRALPDDPDEG